MNTQSPCNDCPRHCNIIRPETNAPGKAISGYCHSPLQPIVARAALHYWEEPCISGTKGSGTIFFTGCNLRCCFCQNADISRSDKQGKQITIQRLRQIYKELIAQGAHNINLVTPTPYIRAIIESLDSPIPIPVVYNCGGYETVETITALQGKIQIYLPDFKYIDASLSSTYSMASNYPEIAEKAILQMYEQVGPYELDAQGILKKGLIIRHLILPNCLDNTKRIIDWVASHFKKGQVLFSLMRQYTPCGNAYKYPKINRSLTDREYNKAEQYLFDSGIEDGFVQEKASASKMFIPSFDGTGV
ncbi:radical SAM protein [Megasphaera paucivorans]|uniref:Putative pyruvate formate lyase activating enzyme n=1 Tax=Megasphaera paucivorans TaxID=349095 RepID=A0A1G9XLL5_9FIRM|nr:radical SAM protein [Megasphaera paucivorans]SDM97658.1 putative pyruvate formate lyase activating enzyme [Megasphaera paucivorans]